MTNRLKPMLLGAVAAAFLIATGFAASAETLVTAHLWDKGAAMEMTPNFAYGVSTADKLKSTMGIKLSRATVPAGKIKFSVTNDSKDTIHELVVLQPADLTKLVYVDAENRLSEESNVHIGEVSELDPGKTNSVTLDMKPGTYLIVCNIPGHYKAGMWELLKVTK